MKKSALIQEIIKPETPGRVGLTVVGTLVFFILLNIPFGVYYHAHPERRGNFQKYKWGMLKEMKEPADWLMLGDSSALDALNPRYFNEAFGGLAISLCTTGGAGVPSIAWFIQKHIEWLGPPKNVVLLNDLSVWTQNFDVEAALVPLSLREWQSLTPPPKLVWENVDRYFLVRWVPMFSQYSLFENGKPWEEAMRDEFTDGHRARTQSKPVTAPTITKTAIEKFGEERFVLTERNQSAMENIIANAEKYGFDVYIVNQPRPEELFKEPLFRQYFDRTQQVFRAFEKQSPRVHYIPIPKSLSNDRFCDEIHVTPAGAAEFSREIANQIKKYHARAS